MTALRRLVVLLTAILPSVAWADGLSPQVREFVRVDAPVVALTHVRVVDGTGAKAAEDQTIVVANGKIAAVGSTTATAISEGAEVLALDGKSVIPGLVGMHNHLFDTAWRNVGDDGRLLAPALIRDLVSHHVAVTSTIPVFDASTIDEPPNPRVLAAMSAAQRQSFLAARARVTPQANARTFALVKKEMEFERAFVAAGGLLLAGPDPTGNGGTLPGFGDWRGLELLVCAGFSPVEAIGIASANGAKYLGRADRIGTIAAGKDADLVVVDGNPAAAIGGIADVVIVFKKGVGYDARKLLDSVTGMVGVK